MQAKSKRTFGVCVPPILEISDDDDDDDDDDEDVDNVCMYVCMGYYILGLKRIPNLVFE